VGLLVGEYWGVGLLVGEDWGAGLLVGVEGLEGDADRGRGMPRAEPSRRRGSRAGYAACGLTAAPRAY
jgi:hypothetical protein